MTKSAAYSEAPSAAALAIDAVSSRRGARIIGAGHAVPPPIEQDVLWETFFDQYYAGNARARRIWEASGIHKRHFTLDPRTEPDAMQWKLERRMERYISDGMTLGRAAIGRALTNTGLEPADIGLFTVVSSTGYAAPGLDVLLALDLDMPSDVRRLLIGHMGCGAAIPALAASAEYVTTHSRPAVQLCVEMNSLHIQPPADSARTRKPTRADTELMVMSSLFADAATAVVLAPHDSHETPQALSGLEVVDIIVRTDANSTDHVTVGLASHGFSMTLAREVPDVVAQHVRDVTSELLRRNGLEPDDVAGWSVHPGGRRILEIIAEQLHITPAAMAPSYEILRNYGNCASATVLLLVERLLTDDAPKGPVVVLGLSPGLTLYAALLRNGS